MKNLTEPWFIGRGWYELGKSFVRAMYFWAKCGFKIMPYHTVWKRRLICRICTRHMGNRCPICGCFLWAITKLASSKCTHWDKYLNVPTSSISTSIEPIED